MRGFTPIPWFGLTVHRFHALAAAFCALMLPASASAAPETVFEGVAGTARIVVAMTADKGEVDGHYFYQRSRLDIDLSGTATGTTLILESRTTGDHLLLKRTGPNLNGTLTTAKARRRKPAPSSRSGRASGRPADRTQRL
jgi:hypothetical protein